MFSLVSLCGEPTYNNPCPSRRTWWIPARLSGHTNPSPPPPPSPFALRVLRSSKGAEAIATRTVYNERDLQDLLRALGGPAFLGWRQTPAHLHVHAAAPLHPGTVQVVLLQPRHGCWSHRRLSGDRSGRRGVLLAALSSPAARGSRCRSPCSSFPPTSGQQHCRNRTRGAGQLGLTTGLKTSNSDGNAAGTVLAQKTHRAANVIKSSLNANLQSKSLETSVLDGCQEHPESSCFKSLQT